MISTINVVFIGFVCVLLSILYKAFTKPVIPNQLKELPITEDWSFVGLVLSLQKPLYKYLFSLKQKHGSIVKVRFGYQTLIVLNDADIMQKALKEQSFNFSGRWQNLIIKTTLLNSGILFMDKEWWTIQRGFVLKVLRDFGLGKKISEEIVNNECSILLKEIEELCGKSISIKFLFPKYMLNVISKLITSLRFERHDPDFQILAGLLEELAQSDDIFATFLSIYPILERIPIISKLIAKLSNIDQKYAKVHNCVKGIIAEHEKKFNPDIEAEDLIDAFLKEKFSLDNRGIKNHTFTDNQLIRVVTELFVAGFDTTASTLAWSMLFLARHPDIQTKVYREITDCIGTSRIPKLADKKSLHYTQAVMDEIFRCSSVVSLSLHHRVLDDTSLDGFHIPKNSIIIPNIYGAHYDKDSWEKPFEFYPEHFLKVIDGELRYSARDDLMPFGIGKRQCLGESLARLEFFTFFTSIFQRFKVMFPKELSDEEYARINVGTDGVIRAPLDTEITFECR